MIGGILAGPKSYKQSGCIEDNSLQLSTSLTVNVFPQVLLRALQAGKESGRVPC